MSEKRYCKVVIIEGEESKLRSTWARELSSSGATIYADGVRYGSMQIDYEDLLLMNPESLGRILEQMKNLKPIKLQEVV
jgi:hypothetical protein